MTTEPDRPLAGFAAEVASPRDRLDALATAETTDDLRSVFSWSYQALSPDAAFLFRQAGVHPAAEMLFGSLASLAGLPAVRTRRLVAELTAAHLITAAGSPAMPGYVVHDLLHVYAGELLEQAGEREQAERRLVTFCTRQVREGYLAFGRPPIADLGPADPTMPVEPVPGIPAALALYDRERDTVSAIVDLALARGMVREAALLVLDRRPMNQTLDPLADSLPQCLRVLDAAAELPERRLVAELHRDIAHRYLRDARAESHWAAALALFEELGDDAGRSDVHRGLAIRADRLGDRPKAIEHNRRSVALAERAGRTDLVAIALVNLAAELLEAGSVQESLATSLRARTLLRQEGVGYLDALVAVNISTAELHSGDPAAALAAAAEGIDAAPNHDLFWQVALHAVAARAALDLGDLGTARSHAARARDLAGADGPARAAARGLSRAELDEYLTLLEEVERALR